MGITFQFGTTEWVATGRGKAAGLYGKTFQQFGHFFIAAAKTVTTFSCFFQMHFSVIVCLLLCVFTVMSTLGPAHQRRVRFEPFSAATNK